MSLLASKASRSKKFVKRKSNDGDGETSPNAYLPIQSLGELYKDVWSWRKESVAA